MALDRQTIEKKDFPIGRRGYDPEAVDAHLSGLADRLEQLEGSPGSTESLAVTASEQVRAIVEVAETSAAQIRSDAQRDAKKVLADARKEMRSARDAAAREAAEHVAKVSQSAAAMVERIDAMEQEANALMASLRTGADRLGADLRLLEANLDEMNTEIAPPGDEPEELEEPELVVAAVVVEEEYDDEPEVDDEHVSAEQEPGLAAAGEPTELAAEDDAAPAATAAGDVDDLEGARLIALNMALNGNSREDIDKYLAENFDLADREGLLDEVYASVEG